MAEQTLNEEFAQFESMTNVELRAELKRRGYSTTGNKKDLLAKLHSAIDKEHQQQQQQQIKSDSTEMSPMKVEKQPLLETNLTAANVMNIENDLSMTSNEEKTDIKDKERVEDQSKSTSLPNDTKTESKSIVEEKTLIDDETMDEKNLVVAVQDDSSSTSNKENIQKREIDEEKSTTIFKKLKRNDFTSSSTTSSSSVFIKGLSRSNNTRVNLSLNLLQTLIPDVTLLSESITNEDLDRHINDSFEYSSNTLKNTDDDESHLTESMTIGDLVDQTQQRTRTVVVDRIINESHVKKSHDTKMNVPMDEPIRVKDVSQITGKATRILHITGLTRPFTLIQLRELLRRYGSFVDDQCWVDKVKSQCLVMYNTIDEAEEARQALDGCRWPTTNPKTMSIRFARQEQFDFSKTHDLPPDQMTHEEQSTSPTVESPAPKSKKREEKNRSETNDDHVSGFLIDQDEPTVENPTEPGKTLDDFFRKTDAKPCIYWLPLTEEEVIERDNRKRERQKKQRDDENDTRSTFKDKTNSNSDRHHRRRRHSSSTSSSREKHKQHSPVAKRDAKRY